MAETTAEAEVKSAEAKSSGNKSLGNKSLEDTPSAGSTGRTLGGVIKRQIALLQYSPGCSRALAYLDQAAGEMDELRRRGEVYYAFAAEDWQEGPEGQAYAAVLDELRLKATALRETVLPDVGRLR